LKAIKWALPAALLACGGEPAAEHATPSAAATPAFEAPVVVNAESPVSYPPDLYQQQVEGTVVLRLHIDENGTLALDSTRVAESSGYPGLDSAALRAVPEMRFAPAQRGGQAVATTFLLPVHFRRQGRASEGTRP
jgi:protein TonB